MDRTDLHHMFLTAPGDTLTELEMLPALEKLVGCVLHDQEFNLRPLFDIVSRLLSLARLPDVDSGVTLNFFGTEQASQHLETLDFNVELDLRTTSRRVQESSEHPELYLAETFILGVKVSEGYGYDEKGSISQNQVNQRYSRNFHLYCSEYRSLRLLNTSSLINSERMLYLTFDVENYLTSHFRCTIDELWRGISYYGLGVSHHMSGVGIPIKIRLTLCILVLGGVVHSAVIQSSPQRGAVSLLRRLACSLREKLPMEEIFRFDSILHRPDVLVILAEYYPSVPFSAEMMHPYLKFPAHEFLPFNV